MRFTQVHSGEWIFPRRRNYYMRCCDCGLTHRVNFKLIKHGRGVRIGLQAFRVKRKGKK